MHIHCRHLLLEDGWAQDVGLELDPRGMIADLRRGSPHQDATLISGHVVPGMPNLHSHGFQALIRGLTGRRSGGHDSFWTWREQMYRAASVIQPGQLEALMGGVFMEMLLAGYTSCAEFHYLHHQPDGQPYAERAELGYRVMSAAELAGIGLTHLPVLYCRSGLGAAGVSEEQRRFRNSPSQLLEMVAALRKVAHGSDLVRIGVAPHSLRAVGQQELDELLAGIGADAPVHIHVAEQPAEVEECVAQLGARPVQWLVDNQPLDARWCLVHATHMLPGEAEAAAQSGAVAGLCPTTEADLGDGLFDYASWRAGNGRFGIGSDSNLRISVDEELRLLEFGQRLASGRRNVISNDRESNGRYLYTRAARGGAQALGQAVGRIAIGCRADLVELDSEHPLLAGLSGDEVLDSWLFAGDSTMLRSVRVAGQCMVEEGRHLRQDQIQAPFDRVMREMRS
jgi:formimidoylglutamate deiminase